MKKFLSVFLCCMIMTVALLPLTAFAWETPSLELEISYNDKKKEITVEYIVNDFAGTESADFVLTYNPEVVEFKDYKAAKIDNTVIEIGKKLDSEDKIAITFVDMYCVQPEDCEEDGSATVATLTFSVTDETAAETVFIATADSCAMDPDSEDVALQRYTEKIQLTAAEAESESTASAFENANVKKIVILAVISLVVFLGILAAVVIKYRKS